jgi:signal transduction histidine kinase
MSCLWAIGPAVTFTDLDTNDGFYTVEPVIAAVSFTFLGALVLTREPANRAGLILLTPAFYTLSGFVVYWLGACINVLAIAPILTLLPFLLPDGRPASRRWRLVFLLSAGVTVIYLAHCALIQYLLFQPGFEYHPSQLVDVLTNALMFLFLICPVAGICNLIARVYTAQGRARSQLLWILLGTSAFVLLAPTVLGDALIGSFPAIGWFVPEQSPPHLVVVAITVAVPVTWGIAILRHGLVQLNPWLHRVLLFVILAVILTLAYVAIRSIVAISEVGAAVVTVGLALCTPSLHRWLSGRIGRLVYGRRGSPAQIVAGLIERLAQAAGPDDVLEALADTVSAAVPTNGVEIALYSGGRELRRTTHGRTDDTSGLVLPLRFQGTELGQVRIQVQVPLDLSDQALLTELCDVAAGAVAAAHRSAELQRARESLVIARERERRRIGRDLHDGLGPVLSGVGFMVDALRERVRDLPEVENLVGDARAQIREASVLIRRVARELRPTAVDQLGLEQALHELVVQHNSAGLHIGLATDIDPHVLTPAVEVAAYAIAAEAVTNVVRHAAATTCSLQLALHDDVLSIIIDDNGTGTRQRPAGLGRVSMQERAEELGGTFHIGPGPFGGCRVEARLPVAQSPLESSSGA